MKMRTTKVEPWKQHTCGECRLGEYIDLTHSRKPDGSPFLKRCAFATWGRNPKGDPITLDSVQACEKLSPKEGVVL